MKTILWATLTANGNYAQSSMEHPAKPEALADFAAQAMAAGNFIVGRKTFENFAGNGGAGPFAALDIVVISQSAQTLPGATVVRSPQEALDYLQARGHTTALLAGGAELHNTFLQQGLVDELIFPIAPVLEGKGYNILLNQNHYQYKDIQLVDFKSPGGGVVWLHYSLHREK